jgi:glyoxylase-like metal-dependent hydrolase (beta-lactamase superfamily II)
VTKIGLFRRSHREQKMKILENLWQVGGDDLSGPGDAGSYLVCFGDQAALVDAGCGNGHRELKANITHCLPQGTAVEYLFLTHCHFDHTGGAERLRKDLGSKIVAHALDAVYLESGDSEVTAASWYGSRMNPLPVDIKLTGEENVMQVGSGRMTALHWPGHSPGSMVLTTRIDGRLVLFGQDVHGPIHPALLSDEAAYQTSLKKILDLDAELLLEGHFGVYRGKDSVRRFISSFITDP